MTVSDPQDRFAFGENWQGFLKNHFSDERVNVAQNHLLGFLAAADLKGKTVLDIGSGSGIHSLAMWKAGAERIVSFDYDPNSVAATRALHARAGSPENWTILQGSVLDANFMAALEPADLVYSWGVLHHTGAQWVALRHACDKVGPDGLLYIALYTADAYINPSPEEWLEIKQKYNQSNSIAKRKMEWDYIWSSLAGRSLGGLRNVLKTAADYKKNRGMSLMVDIRDWLGGWPMEFSTLHEVLSLCRDELGFSLRRLSTGEANNEYLFARAAEASDLSTAIREIRKLDDLSDTAPLYIYGAGLGGDILREMIHRHPKLSVVGFIDKFKAGEKAGLPIVSLSNASRRLPSDTPILVSLPQFGAIASDLVTQGFTQVINGNPLVIEERRRTGV